MKPNKIELDIVKNEVENVFSKELPKNFVTNLKFLYSETQEYHNFAHIISVTARVIQNSEYKELENKQKEILLMASLFHDAGHNKNNTEDFNLKVAYTLFLNSTAAKLFSPTQREMIKHTIYSTDNQKLSEELEHFNKLGRILRDSDISQTLVDDEWLEQLSKETNLFIGIPSTKAWLKSVVFSTKDGEKLKTDFLNR